MQGTGGHSWGRSRAAPGMPSRSPERVCGRLKALTGTLRPRVAEGSGSEDRWLGRGGDRASPGGGRAVRPPQRTRRRSSRRWLATPRPAPRRARRAPTRDRTGEDHGQRHRLPSGQAGPRSRTCGEAPLTTRLDYTAMTSTRSPRARKSSGLRVYSGRPAAHAAAARRRSTARAPLALRPAATTAE